jgi:RimJ/RimL family protein N-acetyltransferase
MIQTNRLLLRAWHVDDHPAFARMHCDSEVMADLGGPIDRIASDRKLDRYRAAYLEHGISRWAVDDADGTFVGYAGVLPRPSADHPLGPHHEIGWRFVRSVWGRGYATESASAALKHAFERCGLREIVSYTSADNVRSQAVMARLKLQRDESRDFVADYGLGPWRGLVWVAHGSSI